MILSQDSFYKYHTPEEIRLAFASELDVGGSHVFILRPTLTV